MIWAVLTFLHVSFYMFRALQQKRVHTLNIFDPDIDVQTYTTVQHFMVTKQFFRIHLELYSIESMLSAQLTVSAQS